MTAVLGANIAAAARCESPSNSNSRAFVSNKRALDPELVARPGRLRISTEKDGVGRFKCVLGNLRCLERIGLISTTLRGDGEEINRWLLLNDCGIAEAPYLSPSNQSRPGIAFESRSISWGTWPRVHLADQSKERCASRSTTPDATRAMAFDTDCRQGLVQGKGALLGACGQASVRALFAAERRSPSRRRRLVPR